MTHVSLSCRQARVHNLKTNEMWISHLHLLLQHKLIIEKLNDSRLSQLPTSVCPQFKHKWNVDIDSASTATTCTYNCRFESGEVSHVSLSCRQACVHNLKTNAMLISNLHLLLRHSLIIAKLNASRHSQLPTSVCPQFEHKWNVDIGICNYCYDIVL